MRDDGMVIQHSGIPDSIHGMDGFNIQATTLHQTAFGTEGRSWVLSFFIGSFLRYLDIQVEYKQLLELNQTNSFFLRDSSVDNKH